MMTTLTLNHNGFIEGLLLIIERTSVITNQIKPRYTYGAVEDFKIIREITNAGIIKQERIKLELFRFKIF
jgi:hypothetical protein